MSETKERLLKRLNHNIKRIKDPTINQLLKDAAEYVNSDSNQGTETQELRSQLETALQGQVSCFDDGDYPAFRQGAPDSSVESLFTAQAATELVEIVKAAKAQAGDAVDTLVEMGETPNEDKEAVSELGRMVHQFEQAGFVGILESYRTAKYKFPECVEAQRKDGQIIAFDVTLPDDTVVTLRNPECVANETAKDSGE